MLLRTRVLSRNGVVGRLLRSTQRRSPGKWSASLSTTVESTTTLEPRDVMAVDVLIVGGGPAGLASAIRLKQLCLEKEKDLSICLIDKGSEIGAHILSGNVFDPKGMNELFPKEDGENDWISQFQTEQEGAHATSVQEDQFLVLTEENSYTLPNMLLPPQLHNSGNYIISLSQVCRWLANRAEDLGVDIYPGFAASEIVYGDNGQQQMVVKGIATRDVGIGKDGQPKATFERGMELHARQTLFAEGARGSCTEELIEKFNLREGKSEQTYGLGIKEVWQIPEEIHRPGLVQHTLGWPLQSSLNDKVFGGAFLYHQEPNLVHLGLVVGLDYANPYLNPYREFQQWKTHPAIRKQLEGGTCISYGARVLNEGGLHSIPKLVMPGAALLGCSAGFLNAVKIKGSHLAIKSGILAAEATFDALVNDAVVEPVAETGELPSNEGPIELKAYEEAIENSWIHDELYQVRNCHEAFARWGIGGGLMYTGLATHVTKGREPWTLEHTHSDADKTQPAKQFQPITYPAPDGVLTFDLLTNLQRSGTYHEDDQPSHLQIKEDAKTVPEKVSMQEYRAPETRFCPAGVYEYVDNDAKGEEKEDSKGEEEAPSNPQLVINAQNCIHCKCCSIKMPENYIKWTVPEGGGGPQYQIM